MHTDRIARDGAAVPVAAFDAVWRWPLRAVQRHLRRARLRAHLHQMDDHMLADIGLTRGDIDGYVRRAFRA